MKSASFVTAIVVVLGIPFAIGRGINVLTYDELFARSDFIVIAEVAEKTKDTPERTKLTDISPPQSAIGVVTAFRCLRVIKGNRKQNFALHHYRIDPSRDDFGEDAAPEGTERVIVNGPTFVSFEIEASRPAFLMFLVRERDGRFAPVAGQIDPDLSIYKLQRDGTSLPNQALEPTPDRHENPSR